MSYETQATKEIAHYPAAKIKAYDGFKFKDANSFKNLDSLGIHCAFDVQDSNRSYVATSYAMDNLQAPITTPTMIVPVQFLQEWAPGFIRIVTQVRTIDEFIGMSIIGSWEMQEVIKTTVEGINIPTAYGDYNNVNFASWNPNYERRTIVRNTNGIDVTALNEARAARGRFNHDGELRRSCTIGLEILRNMIGFRGYNNGLNQTYGVLNDPSLPSYVTVPTGISGFTDWARKTYLEIVRDLKNAAAALITNSAGNIKPYNEPMVLGLANAAVAQLATVSDFGNSVNDFITQTFKGGLRIVAIPEFNAANGGANVFYMFPEKFMDDSTDGGRIFDQMVQTKFYNTGVEKTTNGYKEQYLNATAGVYLSRPWAVYRATGV